MTDTEIIKALNYCVPHKEDDDGYARAERIKLFNFIKGQQSEIKRLNSNLNSMITEYNVLIKNAKFEAIKEFTWQFIQTCIEKQMSKKVIKNEGYQKMNCPHCLTDITEEKGNKYCAICGQHLDWSEENNE